MAESPPADLGIQRCGLWRSAGVVMGAPAPGDRGGKRPGTAAVPSMAESPPADLGIQRCGAVTAFAASEARVAVPRRSPPQQRRQRRCRRYRRRPRLSPRPHLFRRYRLCRQRSQGRRSAPKPTTAAASAPLPPVPPGLHGATTGSAGLPMHYFPPRSIALPGRLSIRQGRTRHDAPLVQAPASWRHHGIGRAADALLPTPFHRFTRSALDPPRPASAIVDRVAQPDPIPRPATPSWWRFFAYGTWKSRRSSMSSNKQARRVRSLIASLSPTRSPDRPHRAGGGFSRTALGSRASRPRASYSPGPVAKSAVMGGAPAVGAVLSIVARAGSRSPRAASAPHDPALPIRLAQSPSPR